METTSKARAWNVLVKNLCRVLEHSGLDEEDMLPTSTSAELGITSIEAMHLLITIEDETGWELDFQALLDGNGKYPVDLTLGTLFDRLWAMSPEGRPQVAAGG